MKRTTFAIAAMCTAMIAGCNPMNRIGSQAATFDRDPFTQLDDANTQVAQQPAQSTAPVGRVSVGNLNAPAPGPGYSNQPAQYAGQPAQYAGQPATSHASYSYAPQQTQMNQPAAAQTPLQQQYAPADFAATPAPQQTMSGPAARAAADAAALLAHRGQPPIQQMSHTNDSAQPSGVTTAAFEPDPFEAFEASEANTPNNGVVPMPPEAVYNAATTQFELSDDDLSIETARPAQPTQDPRFFPGTNIPIPTGRATMSSVMPSQWENEPSPVQPVEPIKANPVFQPPAQSNGAATPAQQPATGVPVIRDSTNQSKWRAVRRN